MIIITPGQYSSRFELHWNCPTDAANTPNSSEICTFLLFHFVAFRRQPYILQDILVFCSSTSGTLRSIGEVVLAHLKSYSFALRLSGSIWEHLDGSVWLFRVAELFSCTFQTILHFADGVYHYQQLKMHSQLGWVCVFECIQKYTSECTWEQAMKYTWQLAFNCVASSMIDYMCRLVYSMSNTSGLNGSRPGWNQARNSGIHYQLPTNRTTQLVPDGIPDRTKNHKYSALYEPDCGSIVQFLQPSWQFSIPVFTVSWHNLYIGYPLWCLLLSPVLRFVIRSIIF